MVHARAVDAAQELLRSLAVLCSRQPRVSPRNGPALATIAPSAATVVQLVLNSENPKKCALPNTAWCKQAC